MPKAKLTATFEGVTATRRSDRSYTHVVFGLLSGELEAQRVEKRLASEQADRAQRAEIIAMIGRGEKPAPGSPLLRVSSVNGYRRFTVWDDVARRTEDAGRTMIDLTHAEALAQEAEYYPARAERDANYIARAAEYRALGDRWIAISWHHSYALALKGADAARSNNSCLTRTQIVEVTK